MSDLTFTAIVRKDGKRYASLCPELDVASCGDTIAEALEELRKAIRLYLKVAKSRPRVRKTEAVFVTQLKLAS
jgi:predicted RNase H-like HicB family nuclease